MKKTTPKLAFGLVLGLAALLSAVSATAGPGDGSVVIIDRVETPNLIIQDLREENYDATHAPVNIRIGMPETSSDDDGALKSARITAWLTTSLAEPDAPRLSEVVVMVGKQWANRSLLIEIPSPGEGEYFVHVGGELRLANKHPVHTTATTTETIRFGQANDCQDVKFMAIPGLSECPVLFDTGSVVVSPGTNAASNEQRLDKAAAMITDLCQSNSLHRVSVRGWASTRHSVNPTNEELARSRATTVVESLQSRVAKACRPHIQSDSIPGTRGVTTQFGESDEVNQCAQIMITGHTCKRAAAGPPAPPGAGG